MTNRRKILFPSILCLVAAAFLLLSGCNYKEVLYEEFSKEKEEAERDRLSSEEKSLYYDTFYETVTRMQHVKRGTNPYIALDDLPKSPDGEVNWTAAVIQGLINPKGSIDPDVPDEDPLNLTLFLEAKVPLMSNVIFPHSIHTYWFRCDACHPGIFIPKAGANPISMAEIFEGEWCGRCHGKVAFNYFPMTNCRRCHIVMKGESLQEERWR